MTPQKLINPKALSAVIRDFFGRSQLSQFMDQINPLAELTHKRRLSALGPGGLSRDRAGFEVRDVHPSHYGRICPIETPKGPNIGLIASLATFARINEFGFLETPYRKVENGRVSEKIDYLTADREEQFIVAQANSVMDDKGHFTTDRVVCRQRGEFIDVEPAAVHYMDISPKQLVSIAASLIPFLEHDDANRALMGSNMQRQAVPLLVTEAPLVATGLEDRVARDSRAVLWAEEAGKVASVNGSQIIITDNGQLPEGKKKIKHDPANGTAVYPVRKFMRSNAATCINQKILVNKGDHVKKGQVIADGPCTQNGELALGRNVLVAFMPWNGYNFEDAIMISEKIVKEDIFTSIHIDEFEVAARDTKLGPEEITRDIPNLGDEALKNLGSDGVIRIGAEVKPGDILVGKITPKSETELAPEERLLRAIFGEKAADVKDTSLKVPSGTYGIVMDVKVSAKKDADRVSKSVSTEEERHAKQIEEDHKKKTNARAIPSRSTSPRSRSGGAIMSGPSSSASASIIDSICRFVYPSTSTASAGQTGTRAPSPLQRIGLTSATCLPATTVSSIAPYGQAFWHSEHQVQRAGSTIATSGSRSTYPLSRRPAAFAEAASALVTLSETFLGPWAAPAMKTPSTTVPTGRSLRSISSKKPSRPTGSLNTSLSSAFSLGAIPVTRTTRSAGIRPPPRPSGGR